LQNNGGKMEFEELNRIPYSLEAERALIGGIFFDVNSLDEIKYIIKSDDFYKKEHAEIYKAIENLLKSRQISLDEEDVVDGEDFELAYCYIGIGDKENAQKYLDSALFLRNF